MGWYRCLDGQVHPADEDYLFNIGYTAFNLGHKHTSNTKLVLKADVECTTWTENYAQVLGARAGSFRTAALTFFGRFRGFRYCYTRTGSESAGEDYGTQNSTSAPFPYSTCIFTMYGNTMSWYKDGNSSDVHSITASGTVDSGIAPLGLFCCNCSDTADGWLPQDYSLFKFYWLEIYENNMLVHRFVPAYNNSQFCLYDEVDEVYIYATLNPSNVRGYIHQ